MKRNKFFMLGIVTVLVAVLSLTFVSNTFAKYTSTVTGSDSARVAKWAFGGVDLTNSEVTFDLFNTNYTDANVDVDGDGDEVVIAPGTTGSFNFTVSNLSEVNALYTIVFEEVDNNIPLQFSLNGTNWVNSIEDLDNDLANKTINMGDAPSYTVHWRWVFEGSTSGAHPGQTDATDTALGKDGTVEYNVTLKIIFTQVD